MGDGREDLARAFLVEIVGGRALVAAELDVDVGDGDARRDVPVHRVGESVRRMVEVRPAEVGEGTDEEAAVKWRELRRRDAQRERRRLSGVTLRRHGAPHRVWAAESPQRGKGLSALEGRRRLGLSILQQREVLNGEDAAEVVGHDDERRRRPRGGSELAEREVDHPVHLRRPAAVVVVVRRAKRREVDERPTQRPLLGAVDALAHVGPQLRRRGGATALEGGGPVHRPLDHRFLPLHTAEVES